MHERHLVELVVELRGCADAVCDWHDHLGRNLQREHSGDIFGLGGDGLQRCGGYSGSATFGCVSGAWQAPTSATCASLCGAEPATTQIVTCSAGYTGAGTSETRTETCNAGTGWAWSAGGWNAVSTDCTKYKPPSLPTDVLVAGGNTQLGCDDSVNVVKTGTYTAMSTWNRSPDGRGADLQTFASKIVENWVYDGTQWNPVLPTTSTYVNLGQNAAHYCR